MQLRRPIAALFTALALFGGGVTMTACEAAGQDQNDGTTDDSENTGGDDQEETDQDDDGDGSEGDDDPTG